MIAEFGYKYISRQQKNNQELIATSAQQ